MDPPERRRGQRQTVGHRERRHRRDDSSPALDQEEHRQDVEQVVDADQNVVHAKSEVGPGDTGGVRRWLDDKRRLFRPEPRHLGRAVLAFDARQHIGDCAWQPLDPHFAVGEAAVTSNGPSFDEAVAREVSPRLGEIDGAFRKDDVNGQTQRFALRRHLPHHVVRVGARLTKLEVGGAEHVGANRGRPRQHQHNSDRPSAQHSAVLLPCRPWDVGVGFDADRVAPRQHR